MSRRKFKSTEWPDDSFVEFEVRADGSLVIETALRYQYRRNFERIGVTISPKDAKAMVERIGRDLDKVAEGSGS